MMNNALQLINDVKNMMEKWNERSSFTIKGVNNLSISDLDSLVLYAESYIGSCGLGFDGLMEPMGSIKDVLDAYGIKASVTF